MLFWFSAQLTFVRFGAARAARLNGASRFAPTVSIQNKKAAGMTDRLNGYATLFL
jgi:hypothetical protein